MTLRRCNLALNCAVLVGSLLLVTQAFAGRIDPELLEKLGTTGPQQKIPIIVKLKEVVDSRVLKASVEHEPREVRLARVVSTLRDKSAVAQQGMRRHLESVEKEGKVKGVKPFWIFNGFALEATPQAIQELAQQSDVVDIIPDRVISLAAPQPAAAVSTGSWNLDRIGVPAAWNLNIKGQGTVVATLDSGVDINHPDLRTRWRGGSNSWYDPYGQHPAAPVDTDGHGTEVMGIIVGGSSSGTPIGVAPAALWIAARIFDDSGYAQFSAIHSSFQWVIAPGGNPADAPDVVNNSWDIVNTGGVDKEFQPDIQQLKAAGIAVVFAAGNEGPGSGTSSSPGNYPESLSVGSTGLNDLVSTFSSRGPSAYDGTSVYPVLTAPGEHILTSGLTLGGAAANPYYLVSGTSFSSAEVSGALALLKSGNRSLTVPQLESTLKSSATDLGVAGPDNSYGYGRLNVAQAVAILALPPLQLPTGDVDGDGSITINDALVLLKTAVGVLPKTTAVVTSGDVAPLVNGAPQPDGSINILDVLVIMRVVTGNIPLWY